MKKTSINFRSIVFLIAAAVFFSACASSTIIRSQPGGAIVYIDNMRVGVTPYVHTDSKIMLSTTHLVLEKEGYEPFEALIVKDEDANVGAIVGGIFIWPVWLWAMKYYPERTYELMPLGYYDDIEYEDTYYEEDHKKSPSIDQETKFKLLRELKKLHDEGILTDDEYQKEKSRILNQGKE